MPGLLSSQDASQVALIGGRHARQAKRHANVAVRWVLAASIARRPEGLLRRSSVEPWDVDADAQLTTLAWVGSNARWAAVTAYCSCCLKLLRYLGDELLSVGRSLHSVLPRETCHEAHLQVVPECLPRDLGKVGGSPRKSPRALPEEGAGRAFLCERGWRSLIGRRS